ncbi:MAG: prolyl oligopeptidase family serine peptidase [Oscillospiraceae bacterium]|nr:prolyl oligopeptidase family serine peptidase [Oscillospiraceae bacterium]
MEKIITIRNLRDFAYCNHRICEKPIRGIVLSFFGLGGDAMFQEDPEEGRRYAAEGILYLVPYQNPWAWMNRQTVRYTDELMDVLFREYNLPDNLPIVSTGGSMGGLSALVYMVYAKRTPAACVANCPVCDLVYHFGERPDLPRTLYSAFGTYEGTMEDALRSASPLHLTEQMPESSKYYIFHCEEDKAVNKQTHSDRFVEKMRSSHAVEYYAVPGRDHCDLTEQMREKYNRCILKSLESGPIGNPANAQHHKT